MKKGYVNATMFIPHNKKSKHDKNLLDKLINSQALQLY